MQGLQRTLLWLWWKGLGNPLWKGYPHLCIARNTQNDVKEEFNRISEHFIRAVQRRPHVSYATEPILLLEAHGGTQGKGIARKQCSGGRTVGFTQIV